MKDPARLGPFVSLRVTERWVRIAPDHLRLM